jgi:hypothetical protein
VPALARDLPGRVENDGTDERVRFDRSAAALGQRKRVPHPAFKIGSCHSSLSHRASALCYERRPLRGEKAIPLSPRRGRLA